MYKAAAVIITMTGNRGHMQMRCLPMLFSRFPWSLPGRLGTAFFFPMLRFRSVLLRSDLASSSPFLAPSLQVSLPLVCVLSVRVCILKEAGVERMYNYTQRQDVTGVRPCRRLEVVTWWQHEARASTEVAPCIARL